MTICKNEVFNTSSHLKGERLPHGDSKIRGLETCGENSSFYKASGKPDVGTLN